MPNQHEAVTAPRQSGPRRVLVITGGTAVAGGVETNLLLLLQAFDPSAITPIVVMPGDGPLTERVRALGVACEIVPYYGWRLPNPFRHLETLARLVQVTRGHHAQVIYLNHHCMLEFAVKLAALTQLPLVCHMRGVENAAYMKDNHRRLHTADVIIATSEAVRSNLLHWGVPEGRIQLIYDAIDLGPFMGGVPRSSLRTRYGFPPATPMIGAVSRVIPEKGIGDLVAAAALVIGERPDARFTIVGTDNDGGRTTRQFESLAISLGLENHLFFTGFQEDLIAVLNDLDVFVLPSWMEACPLSLMEAMAAGVLVVATDVGGIPEIVENRVHGLLCPPHEPQILAKLILEAMTMTPSDRNTMRARALARIRERFVLSVQAGQLQQAIGARE